MLRTCGLVGLLAVVLGVGLAPRADAQPAGTLKIGFPQALFKDVSPELVQVAAKPFQSMIQKTTGLTGTMEVVRDYKVLTQHIKDGKLDLAVFHGFEYAWVKHTPEIVPLVSTVPGCGKVQAVLVVNANSKAIGPADLKGACVSVPKGSKAHCQMFLDWLHAEHKIPPADCCPCNVAGLTPEEALEMVGNKKCEAALVDISAWLAYQNNQPGSAGLLKVLARSEELPSAVVVHRKDAFPAATITKLRQGLVDCHKNAQGKVFLMFWNLKGFEDVSTSANYAKQLENCLAKYPEPK